MRTAVVTMICIMSLCASAFADDFRGIDINKDGRIDLQEFQGFVKEIGPSKIRQFDADADGFLSEKEFAGDGNFKKEDANRDGKIDPQEGTQFLVAVIAPTKFKSYDMNRDGYLDQNEFEAGQKK